MSADGASQTKHLFTEEEYLKIITSIDEDRFKGWSPFMVTLHKTQKEAFLALLEIYKAQPPLLTKLITQKTPEGETIFDQLIQKTIDTVRVYLPDLLESSPEARSCLETTLSAYQSKKEKGETIAVDPNVVLFMKQTLKKFDDRKISNTPEGKSQ